MLGGRLRAAAEFVRQGAVFADIGTDHAYLPVFLLKSGKIKSAVCSDVNRGPLENARATAAAAGICENIEFRLADGLSGFSDLGITDVAICGMGGELIADIIDRAPFLKKLGTRLILQPMSKQEHLLRYLDANGFSLVDYSYAEESGKYYIVLSCEFTGCASQKAECELEFLLPRREYAPLQRAYLAAKLASLEKSYRGKSIGGIQDDEDAIRIEYVRKMISSLDIIINEECKQ